ncbi:DNA translocase FtsK [Streptomyces sp. NPDC087422]|uniref:DNA translocase FtsK n=1 Tax=Streptomyces sp. NPDC087422 TaxID=3365786 RepID=UPI00381A94AC
MITDDPDLDVAIRLVADARLGSASFLARQMKIPFAAAAVFLDQMEVRGIVGPAHGSRAREVRVRACHRCGRVGTRGFYVREPDWVTGNRTACRNHDACDRRR